MTSSRNEKTETPPPRTPLGLGEGKRPLFLLGGLLVLLLAVLLVYDRRLYQEDQPAIFEGVWAWNAERMGQSSSGGGAGPRYSAEAVRAFQDQVDDYLRSVAVREHDWIGQSITPRFSSQAGDYRELARTVLVPATFDTQAFLSSLPAGGELSLDVNDSTAVLLLGGSPVYSLTVLDKGAYYAERRSARVAIVIDDCGYGGNLSDRFLRLPYNLTFAVLPYLPHTRSFAEEARAKGREVILHLPMEPRDPSENDPGEGAVLVAMTPEAIRVCVEEDLAQVPFAVGANNHMGSLATSDPAVMEAVLGLFREKNLFFVDSWTWPGSVASQTARAMGVPTAVNDIFLDNVRSREALLTQLRKVRDLALSRGDVICIGHATSSWTLYTLEDVLPVWQREGIQIVPVSELVH